MAAPDARVQVAYAVLLAFACYAAKWCARAA
jgi:hypothetical protein